MMESIPKALRLKKELDAMRPIAPEQEARIMQKFRLDWNYHSNHLEGNSLTFGETKTLLLYGITAQGKPLKDHIEMTGHNEALNWVLDIVKGDRPLTESFIRELHVLLLKETYEVDAITPDGQPTKRWITVGDYKSVPNHVRTQTGEIHYFATVEETRPMMAELIDWYREQREKEDTNPIFLAALFHHRFISIHPFDDGNGRTGRILMNFILMQYGFPPVIIKTDDKINYYRALQQADGGNVDAFVEYVGLNLVRSLEIMLAGARGESIEEPDDLDKELALLEQRLRGMGKRVEMMRSETAIKTVILESIWPLGRAILKEQERFRKFYKYFSAELSIEGSGHLNLRLDLSTSDILDSSILKANARAGDVLEFTSEGAVLPQFLPYRCRLSFSANSFVQLDLRNVHFYLTLEIEFQETYWQIKKNQASENDMSFLYSEPLGRQEVGNWANTIARLHKETIEKAIQGIEKK